MRWFWLDRFTEFVSGSHATALKCVSLSEDYLHDHWDCYPVMPNSLVAEGMAQTGGLLVSELYAFAELVVLAKFAKCVFDGEVRPGETLHYRAEIQQAKEAGASVQVTAHVGDRQYAEAEIFFARLNPEANGMPADTRLFDPAHLLHWLRLVGVFDVGVRPDGSRLRPQDYGFAIANLKEN
jgi:3-hydroxyacyl-[acyl-carrier-protein] dehydratase